MKKLLYLIPVSILWISCFIWDYFSLNSKEWYAFPYLVTSIVLIVLTVLIAFESD